MADSRSPQKKQAQQEAQAPSALNDASDSSSLYQTIGTLFETLGTDAFYPRLKEILLQKAPFEDIIILNCYAEGAPTCPFIEVKDPSPESYTAFLQGLYAKSPFYKFGQKGGSGFKTLRQLAPDDFYESTFYYAIMNTAHITDEATYIIQGEEDIFYLICLGRSNKLEVFSPKEVEEFSQIFPMLEHAILRHDWLRKILKLLDTPNELKDPITLRVDELTKDLLTDREREIVGYLVRGYSSKACAMALQISPGTERVHRKNIYQKLGVKSQSELLAHVFDYLA